MEKLLPEVQTLLQRSLVVSRELKDLIAPKLKDLAEEQLQDMHTKLIEAETKQDDLLTRMFTKHPELADQMQRAAGEALRQAMQEKETTEHEHELADLASLEDDLEAAFSQTQS